jgi:glutathione synthase/RimK-type ligase-like ATP-grasp enzyme
MDTTTTDTAKATPKTARASRKKTPTHQTHGALAPAREPLNMMKLFGIRDGYDTDDLDTYKEQINAMSTSDLHEHSHAMGIVPLDARDKLTTSLERLFVQSKLNQRGPRTVKVKTNPALADFMAKHMAALA